MSVAGGCTQCPQQSKGWRLEVNALEERGQRSHGFCVTMCSYVGVGVSMYASSGGAEIQLTNSITASINKITSLGMDTGPYQLFTTHTSL